MRTQLDVLRPVEPAPPSPFAGVLAAAGASVGDEVVGPLLERDGVTLVADTLDHAARTATTMRALREGARLVVGGRLPVDREGRRAGGPDLLVRVGSSPVAGRWRYAPVDVTSHGVLRDPGTGTDVVVQDVRDLAVPGEAAEAQDVGRRDRTGHRDSLRLAHHHRMLAAAGHAGDGPAWGGVVGREGVVAWSALDLPRWAAPTGDPDDQRQPRTSLELYDVEFGLRLDVAAVAGRHLQDPTVELLVQPVRCSECDRCPWREHCLPQLERRDDPSLLPRVRRPSWRALRDAGMTTIADVASPDAPASVPGIADDDWAELRLQARARTSPAPVVPRGAVRVRPPRADVEVDVDMENVLAGAYLWGVQVTDRAGTGLARPGYRAFVTWESPLGEEGRADAFVRFWTWLRELRRGCGARGVSLAAYCWYEAAENRHLREGAALTGLDDEVEAFIGSTDWIDLHRWFDDHHVTGRGNGLKTVATLLGFAWRDDDPSGAASMAWHADATDPDARAEDRAAARARLLAYNEDDVRATLVVRERLDRLARDDAPVP